MSSLSRNYGWWRPAALIAVLGVLFILSVGSGSFRVSTPPAAGMMQSRDFDPPAGGTPVASAVAPDAKDPSESEVPVDSSREGTPVTGDPLDGDPLDGKPPDADDDAPKDQTQLDIVRSARPSDEPETLAAYDGDPATTWMPEADSEETWLWLDLGAERRLRAVRWLARGSGVIEVSLSSDQQRWREVDRLDVARGWQGIDVREDARYVRLTLHRDDDGQVPAITEAAVYGSEREEVVSTEQRADSNRDRKRDRRERRTRDAAAEQQADETGAPGNGGDGSSDPKGQVRISAEPGENRCGGNRERCEARQGTISVEDSCDREGSCTIDIRADGGTAICDASGDDRTETGDGEGKRSGRGGRCEAVANGGAVTVGDINP